MYLGFDFRFDQWDYDSLTQEERQTIRPTAVAQQMIDCGLRSHNRRKVPMTPKALAACSLCRGKKFHCYTQ
jgi:hypothetical protein